MRLFQAILSFQSVIIYLDMFNFCCARQYVMKVPILVATIYLGPRTGIAFSPETVIMGNPTFCCAGLFITWWGYLAMNSASTLGVEGTRWLQSAKGTVTD